MNTFDEFILNIQNNITKNPSALLKQYLTFDKTKPLDDLPKFIVMNLIKEGIKIYYFLYMDLCYAIDTNSIITKLFNDMVLQSGLPKFIENLSSQLINNQQELFKLIDEVMIYKYCNTSSFEANVVDRISKKITNTPNISMPTT